MRRRPGRHQVVGLVHGVAGQDRPQQGSGERQVGLRRRVLGKIGVPQRALRGHARRRVEAEHLLQQREPVIGHGRRRGEGSAARELLAEPRERLRPERHLAPVGQLRDARPALLGRRGEQLERLRDLINLAAAGQQRRAQDELCKDAAERPKPDVPRTLAWPRKRRRETAATRPNVDGRRVRRGTEQQFWRAVPNGACGGRVAIFSLPYPAAARRSRTTASPPAACTP